MNNIIINSNSYKIPDISDLPIKLVIKLYEIYKAPGDRDKEQSEPDYQQLFKNIFPEVCGETANAEDFIISYSAYIAGEISCALNTQLFTENCNLKAEGLELIPVKYGYDGNEVYLADVSAENFCDATDLFISNKLKYAPVIVALLSSNERITGRELLSKISEAGEKPFSVALSVFALLQAAHKQMREAYPYCYKSERQDHIASPAGTATWNDILIMTAGGVSSEIEALRKMKIYDFMDILNCKTKYLSKYA